MTVKIVRTDPDGGTTVVGVLGEMYAHMSRAEKLRHARQLALSWNARAVREETGATYRAEAS